MKARAIVRIVVFTALIAALSFVMVGGMVAGSIGFHFGDNGLREGIVSSEGQYPATGVLELDIRWSGGKVILKTGDTQMISFQETGAYSQEDTMIYQLSGNKLTIQYRKPQVYFGMSFSPNAISKELVIVVPDDWQGSVIRISNVSAVVDVQDVICDRFQLENVSGRCWMTRCTIGQLEAETVSGSVEIDGTVEEVSLEAVSGECRLELSGGVRSVEMETVSGDMELYLPESKGFTAEIDTVSGDFASEFTTSVSGDMHRYGDGACQISMESVSGDLSIKKRDAGTVYDIEYRNAYSDRKMLVGVIAEEAEEGTQVIIRTKRLGDGKLCLFVDGRYACDPQLVDAGEGQECVYQFTMPSHDVVLSFEEKGQ